jgi:heme O synthase-like polyprenyltransferase
LTVVLALAGVVAVAYIVYGGYMYIQSRGGDTEKPKKTITYALVGLVVIFIAFALQQFVAGIVT